MVAWSEGTTIMDRQVQGPSGQLGGSGGWSLGCGSGLWTSAVKLVVVEFGEEADFVKGKENGVLHVPPPTPRLILTLVMPAAWS